MWTSFLTDLDTRQWSFNVKVWEQEVQMQPATRPLGEAVKCDTDDISNSDLDWRKTDSEETPFYYFHFLFTSVMACRCFFSSLLYWDHVFGMCWTVFLHNADVPACSKAAPMFLIEFTKITICFYLYRDCSSCVLLCWSATSCLSALDGDSRVYRLTHAVLYGLVLTLTLFFVSKPLMKLDKLSRNRSAAAPWNQKPHINVDPQSRLKQVVSSVWLCSRFSHKPSDSQQELFMRLGRLTVTASF